MNTCKTLTKKEAQLIANYLNAKLSELTAGLNYWGAELAKIDNTPQRQDECSQSIASLHSAYDEIYSMYTDLKLTHKL
jgi:hypothetical protein